MTSPLLRWLVETGHSPYSTRKIFGQDGWDGAIWKGWTIDRMGMSRTVIPDGREVFVAGEHEDYYDPDFRIFNDLIVRGPGGDIEVYGYPKDILPPTDFHTATLLGGELLVVGSIGYPDQRGAGVTPVTRIEIDTWRVAGHTRTTGGPGWLCKHEVEAVDGRLVVRGGEVGTDSFRRNCDEWSLDPATLDWTRLTRNEWPQFRIGRADGDSLHVWQIDSERFRRDYQPDKPPLEWIASLPAEPDFGALASLYELPGADGPPEGDEHETLLTRTRVGGVPVEMYDGHPDLRVTVCGVLPERRIEEIAEHLRDRLSRIEQSEIVAERIA